MKKGDYLYPSGEFARLAGVNKRTLHYYHDIGLFCPAVIGENGYHYYSCFQFAQLELILTLRKIGLSIEEIREYVTGPSDESFSQMMEKKKRLIDASIRELLSVQAFLEKKSQRLQAGFEARHGEIELCTLPERKIIWSAPISGRYDEGDFSVAAEFSLRLKKLFHLYDSFGSRISMDAVYKGEFNSYESFFAYCPGNSEIYDEILPEGVFLRAYCVGPWNRLGEVYRKILHYAEEKRLTLSGCAYEEGLNEMAVRSQEDYVTMITIPCADSGREG